MSTLCPKIGTFQWSCTREECTCHLKSSLPAGKSTCLHCGHTEYSDCPSFYRHLGDTLPYGCLLKGGVE
jgi:hypothetical protein